jgi:hypothetical protein
VFIPRGVVHAFRNTARAQSTFLVTYTMPAYEGFWEEMAELIKTAPRGSPDPQKVAELATRYDTEFMD